MEAGSRYCINVEGVNIPRFFSKECFESALRFKPKKGDIIIATYPKCGTTWMQNLVLNILRKGEPLEKPSDFFLASPFLDMLGAEDSEKVMIKPGAYKTHLPLHKVLFSDEAKYIYVARNPKDCCVSLYHHMKQHPAYNFAYGTFDEFLDMFVKGETEFGKYWEHLLPWYNARSRPNIYFTTFENMKSNLKQVAVEVAAFIDEEYAEYLQDNSDVLDTILHNCSFEEMRKLINEAMSSLYDPRNAKQWENLPEGRKHVAEYSAALPKIPHNKINFIRRGEVGSWKSELTSNQNEVLVTWTHENTKNTDVMSLWEDII